MTDYPVTGIDVSRWQYLFDAANNIIEPGCDYNKAALMGASFMAARVTVGNYYTDLAYPRSILDARAAGLWVSGYHVVNPANTSVSQMDRFFGRLEAAGIMEDFPLVLDCEMANGQTPYRITQIIHECAERVKYETGDWPLIYTGVYWWNVNTLYHPDWLLMPLWVANYTTAAAPMLPRDWRTWVIWQWSADGNNMGALYGMQSNSVDLNRFNGTVADWEAFVGYVPEVPPEEHETVLRVIRSVNVRAGAGTNFPIIRVRAPGEYVTVADIIGSASNVWIKDAQGYYSAYRYVGLQYMEPAG